MHDLKPEAQESFSLVTDRMSQMLSIVLKADFCVTSITKHNDFFFQTGFLPLVEKQDPAQD